VEKGPTLECGGSTPLSFAASQFGVLLQQRRLVLTKEGHLAGLSSPRFLRRRRRASTPPFPVTHVLPLHAGSGAEWLS